MRYLTKKHAGKRNELPHPTLHNHKPRRRPNTMHRAIKRRNAGHNHQKNALLHPGKPGANQRRTQQSNIKKIIKREKLITKRWKKREDKKQKKER